MLDRFRNRDELDRLCLYDMLIKLQQGAQQGCILKGFDENIKCDHRNNDCKKCIEEWLNKERR